MSRDYVLNQKCPACGTNQESTLSAIKAQRLFECQCCGLVIKLRERNEEEQSKQDAVKKEQALVV